MCNIWKIQAEKGIMFEKDYGDWNLVIVAKATYYSTWVPEDILVIVFLSRLQQ